MPRPDTSNWPRNRYRYAHLDDVIVCTELDSAKTCVYASDGGIPSSGMVNWYLFCAIDRIQQLEQQLNLPREQRTVGDHLRDKYVDRWVEPETLEREEALNNARTD